MMLDLSRPQVPSAPEHPPACCTQKTVTVPPSVNAKTAKRHDCPARTLRLSYARRSSAERSKARIEDPGTIDVARGWCRVMGLSPMSMFVACALVVRNLAVEDAFELRTTEGSRRLALGQKPRTRRRRRRTLSNLATASANTSP